MATENQGIVRTLLAAVVVLLAGIAALLWVAHNRHQRLLDETQDLRRNLHEQSSQIKQLENRLQDCDTVQTAVDSSWSARPSTPTGVARRTF
ncbi:hypothetical protein DYU11_24705 [Fibrisoma montanum]|uniref:Uncharacterized protein n=1 Tax=Fibrisoma montanum TaxID=2305895 RepID=A0A418M114_9BACT|nr:hypothetical protein [Fibrisoma montanum]RIV19311.1 hypothetical protein DYU11_24705 [Fibrisoma montanum]